MKPPKPLKRSTPLRAKTPLKRTAATMARTRLRPRSKKMAKVYVERAALVKDLLAPGARCAYPGCTDRPTEVHERWTRARSGNTGHAILCRANCVPLCATHHRLVTDDTGHGEALGLVLPSEAGCPCGFKTRDVKETP